MQNPARSSIEQRQTRIAYIFLGTLMVAAIVTAALFSYFASVYALPELFIPALILLATLVFDALPLSLMRRGRKNLAMMLLITVFIVDVMVVLFIVQGLGLIIALSIVLVVVAIVGLTMPAEYTTSGVIVAILAGAATIALDSFLEPGRLRVPELERYVPYVVALIAAPILFVFTREYGRFSLQAKITLGIIVTGGIAVGVISFFALAQLSNITNLLSERLETNVRRLAEEELVNTVERETVVADEFFAKIANVVDDLAAYRTNLQGQQGYLWQGTYWNASQRLVQLEGGQYGNSAQDPSSVFIPIIQPLDEAALVELNTSAYLDFVVPHNLEENSSILAIYAIDSRGIVRYYPNIELASLLPPDFDATQRPYYKITSPLFNPNSVARWTIPYVDAAGGGLVVTVASPLYYNGVFNGVLAADIQLSAITEQLSSIKIGQSGFAFMVDDAGRLIYMPPAGYEMFGIDPNVLVADDFYKYTVLGEGSAELQNFTNRMVAGGSGLGMIQVNGEEHYISFAPVQSNGYSLALIVPTAEMQTAIPAARQDIEGQLSKAIQTASIILAITFFGALIISIVLGQLISSPVRSMTKIANRVAGGDLNARVKVATSDETGVLAASFNTMADRLSETLHGLEDRISERTRELQNLSQANAYRASLFESIARVSRAIGSTHNQEQLLPQITETISDQLGYYHVGIFLVDVHREFAVLAAANSEGGKVMLTHGHRLRIGETGIVGFVTQSGNPRVALDVGQDAVYFNNPNLPETHSEIALPLKSGLEIIGALDVQSKVVNAFSDEDVNILSVLAEQVSIAIQNARSFQKIHEAREQAEHAAAQLSEQHWSRFLKRQPVGGFHFDGVTARPVKMGHSLPANKLAIPILLRGVQIGTLKLSTTDPERKWDNNEIAMAQATAERAALAIENARLLHDAQKRVAKEHTIGQITSKIGSLVNIENIVKTTIQELGNSLPDTDVAIQFTSGQSGQSV